MLNLQFTRSNSMKPSPHRTLSVLLLATTLLSACQSAQDARMAGVQRQQDRIDARAAARQERWSERAAHEDARAEARFNSW